MTIDTSNNRNEGAHPLTRGLSARRQRLSPWRAVRGFTLVEIMVAVTIGLIVLVAVAQIFATSRATYGLEEGLARVQENGRFGTEFLARDLRMAGFAGCLNVNQVLNANADYTVSNRLNNSGFFENAFAPGLHIRGHEWVSAGIWNPVLPGFLNGKVADQTDVLVIRRGAEQSYRLAAAMATDSADITIPEAGDIELNDIVLIADCNSADVIQVTSSTVASPVETLGHDITAGTPGNVGTTVAKAYGGDAEVMRLVTRAYYIGWRGDDSSNPPGLFRREMGKGTMGNAQELVEHVDSMQLIYGEDTNADGSADIYRLPAAVTDWSRVVSVRLALLLRTPEQSGPDKDTTTYDLLSDAGNSDDFGPANDNRQRRIFATTVQLRNLRTD
ncbi:MAG: PilW family protein [Acidiferrobacterales bacterium]